MFDFDIQIPDRKISFPLWRKINSKTKPTGSLGKLEQLALQVGIIQQTLTPALLNPHIVVFAGSHGIADEGVSAYPKEVTYQMVLNFLAGGAAINVFTKQHGINLTLVDAGVDHDFKATENLIQAKINRGTKNFVREKAMTEEEVERCFNNGRNIVSNIRLHGCNIIGFGEMGIGNTSSASAIMSKLLNIPIAKCIGRGTGLDDDQLKRKKDILEQALKFHKKTSTDPIEVLQTFGGFEIAMMTGAMLKAAEEKMVLMVDGFISSVAFLAAYCINPEIKHYAVFSHISNESGHSLLLKNIEADPLLNLNMRLGEGTGCAVAYPLIQSAVSFLNNMASFEEAGVSKGQ
jgi:nicotinate-nucleotide--dimethylbenzimidazole phosphoribosyltransferase